MRIPWHCLILIDFLNHYIRSLPNANYVVLQTNPICLCGSVSWVIITSSSCFQKLMASMVSKLGFFTRKSKDSWYSCWENQEPFRCFRIFALCALVLVFVSPGATTAMFTKSDDGGMQEWEATPAATKQETSVILAEWRGFSYDLCLQWVLITPCV